MIRLFLFGFLVVIAIGIAIAIWVPLLILLFCGWMCKALLSPTKEKA